MTSCTEKTNVEVWSKESFQKLQNELLDFEKSLHTRTKNLQKHLQNNIRENILEENCPSKSNTISDVVNRIQKILKSYIKTEEGILTENKHLQKQIEHQQSAFEEVQMERDVLLERIHTYLETNSSLKIRLEEQRCQTETLQRQLDGDLESRARVLEKDNERLNNLILEKDKELKKMNYMLEKVVNRKVKKEEIIENLRKKLMEAMIEKVHLEEENKKLQKTEILRKKNLKRSLSTGSIDTCSEPLFKVNTVESNQDFNNFNKLSPCLCTSTPNKLSPTRSSEKVQEKHFDFNKKTTEPGIHVQLNALKSGLVNVTQKLKVLKSQLITPNSPFQTEARETQKFRNLKRKAEPLENEEAEEEEQKERKNLKDILEDAKNLNAKLQNLREEKQKIIETNKQSFEKNEKFSQTSVGLEEKSSSNVFHVQKVIDKLRMTLAVCEEKLDRKEINKEEASDVLLSAFSSCVFSNLRYFHESEKRGVNSLKDEIDMELLMDRKSKGAEGKAREGETRDRREEDGGGDNHLKNKMESDMRGYEELKFQISKIKLEIENFKKLAA